MSNDGEVKVDVMLLDETVWLTQSAMQELFGRAKSTISEHIKNVYDEGELEEFSTVRKFRTVQLEGKREVDRELEYYNLDVIISVGYRVKSHRGTQFRIWATKILREYIIKGFALDDERLKQGETVFGRDYFRELLDRIREIRASERRFYQKITDIYAQCSIDYDAAAPMTKEFYATVQTRLHCRNIGYYTTTLQALSYVLLHICNTLLYLCTNKTRQASRKISSFGRVFAFIEVPFLSFYPPSNGTCEIL